MFDTFWKEKFKIQWCHHCDVAIIICPDCNNSSCNGGGCNTCQETFSEFRKGSITIDAYLTPEETKVYDKCRYIQSFILTALEGGSLEINWKKLLEDGKFSEHSSKLFAKELSDAPNILS